MISQIPARHALAILCLSFSSLDVFADNGLRPIGIGQESTTLGGATVAKSLGATSQFSNPAGLTGVSGTDLQTSVSYAVPTCMSARPRQPCLAPRIDWKAARSCSRSDTCSWKPMDTTTTC
jgi:hypothetical protein